jgi:hypothetical protein
MAKPEIVDRRAHEDEQECFERHEHWFEQSMAPKVRLIIISTLLGAAALAVAVVFFLSRSVVKDHELEEVSKFETVTNHDRDMTKIENRMERMETNLSAGMEDVKTKLDRNLRYIERREK